MKTIPLLEKDDIEVKIQKVGKGGAVAVLYKTARVDMAVLDDVFGPENWSDEYTEIKGNLYCTIRIKSGDQWIGKQDCGIESRSDGDGNEKKGEASDAFKRAAVKWGIGRELYSAPFIFMRIETTETPDSADLPDWKKKYRVVKRFEKYSVSEITYDDSRHIKTLEIKDSKGNVLYAFGETQSMRDIDKKNRDAGVRAIKSMVDAFCKSRKLTHSEFLEELEQYTTVPYDEIEFEDMQRYINEMEREKQ